MAASKKVQLALIAAGAVALAGAFVVFGLPPREEAVTSAGSAPPPKQVAQPKPVSAPKPPPPTPARPPEPEVATPPAFDIVRVGPQGDAVIAGRATPGKRLELLVNGKVHDTVEVRESGAFALTPPPLPPGDHELILREVGTDGAQTLSRQSVTVVLSAAGGAPPVVALTEPDKPTALLSSGGVVARELNGTQEADIIAEFTPGEDAAAPTGTPASATGTPPAGAPATVPEKVAIVTVEAEAGRLYVSGNAPREAAVRLYLNDTFLAQGKASDRGALSFRIESGIPPGDYRVRLDEVTPADGKVLSRAEVAFSMPETSLQDQLTAAGKPDTQPQTPAQAGDGSNVVVPGVETVRVDRGDSLWRISRRIYGQGLRYTVIYDANQQQIRNPDRIYPGQLFVLPRKQVEGAQ